MKKLFLMMTLMIGALTAQADTYTYLTFETTDGAKVSVPASSLTLTFSGTTLTVGSQSFTLTNLSKMYFSNSDETTGIQSIDNGQLTICNDVYDLQGRKISKDDMRSGKVYIIKTNSGTHKIAVK